MFISNYNQDKKLTTRIQSISFKFILIFVFHIIIKSLFFLMFYFINQYHSSERMLKILCQSVGLLLIY